MVCSTLSRYAESDATSRSGFATATTGYPFACKKAISLLQLVESANAPCTSTIVGLTADPLVAASACAAAGVVTLVRAAPPPPRTAAATSGTVKARVIFFIIGGSLLRAIAETAIYGLRCPYHWQAAHQVANADFVSPDAGKASGWAARNPPRPAARSG